MVDLLDEDETTAAPNFDLRTGLFGQLKIEKPQETEYIRKLREEFQLYRARKMPYIHQVVGVKALVENPYFFIADEMGAGKTKQVIDAAMLLFEMKMIDRVIVIGPAAVRTVWFDPELGELATHLWNDVPNQVAEYHGKIKIWRTGPPSDKPLKWIITNYDFIRDRDRRRALKQYCSKKTLLVLDESWAIKSSKAQQTKSCVKLRESCGRVVLLNGTPVTNSPGDLRSQGNIMHKGILDCPGAIQFRSRYGIMGGWGGRKVVKWQNLDDLSARFAPYILRRLKEDCLDLPKKNPSIHIEVKLTEETWRMYRDMRDDLVAWLDVATASQASQAAVKVMRLQQITSGFIGGVKALIMDEEEEDNPDVPSFMKMLDLDFPTKKKIGPLAEIGREKLDATIWWITQKLKDDPNFKFIIWARFVPEVNRLAKTLHEVFGFPVGKIIGGQKEEDRQLAKRLLTPQTMPSGPCGVVGSPAAGGIGLTLVGTHDVLYSSNDWSLKNRLQSEDRPHRPGQLHDVNYYDLVAIGPKGQKTIDIKNIRSLQSKHNIAEITTSAWKKALLEE